MRNSHVCPKCQHNHVLLIAQIPDTGEYASDINALHIATAVVGTTWFGNPQHGRAGKLEAAVCKRCGYTELYTVNPERIPVDGTLVREVIGPEQTPYR